ncbi:MULTISPECIES: hypothetical protein [Bacillus]|uniref:hypothetical protein n=1 Tax=Bacillus TaxID=1386 RepID=UPI000BECB50C|nr:hypothetical protein [Bacillus cereus]PDZ79406.1 hypothetical protein CON31_12235 [Bacillus cereus]PFB33610.1 hypothetical protein CN392_17695 [Bacillus cereus]PFO32883.1 hypothetical protein COJ82_27785 [Bacillus cereus]PFQ34290.1 hypothetical protein COK33_20375 [Bacillus cereus]PGR20170.1 hypothetical protein COA25_08645 [Bacillus cereus]
MSNRSEDFISQQVMVTPAIQLHGPYNWVQRPGESGFLTGQKHVWSVGPFVASTTWTAMVMAHPWQQYSVQGLEVQNLQTGYSINAGPSLTFVVFNFSNGISGYRYYISLIGQQTLKSEEDVSSPPVGVQRRVFAIHDVTGYIKEVVTGPVSSPMPVLQTEPGWSITEINIPTDIDETEIDSFEGLIKLMESYRVQVVDNKVNLLPIT